MCQRLGGKRLLEKWTVLYGVLIKSSSLGTQGDIKVALN